MTKIKESEFELQDATVTINGEQEFNHVDVLLIHEVQYSYKEVPPSRTRIFGTLNFPEPPHKSAFHENADSVVNSRPKPVDVVATTKDKELELDGLFAPGVPHHGEIDFIAKDFRLHMENAT